MDERQRETRAWAIQPGAVYRVWCAPKAGREVHHGIPIDSSGTFVQTKVVVVDKDKNEKEEYQELTLCGMSVGAMDLTAETCGPWTGVRIPGVIHPCPGCAERAGVKENFPAPPRLSDRRPDIVDRFGADSRDGEQRRAWDVRMAAIVPLLADDCSQNKRGKMKPGTSWLFPDGRSGHYAAACGPFHYTLCGQVAPLKGEGSLREDDREERRNCAKCTKTLNTPTVQAALREHLPQGTVITGPWRMEREEAMFTYGGEPVELGPVDEMRRGQTPLMDSRGSSGDKREPQTITLFRADPRHRTVSGQWGMHGGVFGEKPMSKAAKRRLRRERAAHRDAMRARRELNKALREAGQKARNKDRVPVRMGVLPHATGAQAWAMRNEGN